MNLTILRYDQLGSTNTEAIAQAKRGATEGLVIIAREQTAGRGRNSRSWVSEKDAGLFFSIVLRPTLEPKHLPLITMMAAVAVHETLRNLGLSPDIKWPNDVLVKGKKICGILAEATETSLGRAVILGIGINLRFTDYPPEIAALITSLENETGNAPDAEKVLETLTNNLSHYYDLISSDQGPTAIRNAWSERSSYFEGLEVIAAVHNKTICGITRGIEESGALRIETDSGDLEIVHAGDVERLRRTE